jgi:hypothetical protein
LIAQVLTGHAPDLDLAPFRPDRFPASASASDSDSEEAS